MRIAVQFAAAAALVAAGLPAQETVNPNQTRQRGQTQTRDAGQSPNRGRLGTQDAVSPKAITIRGLLVDAQCRDRSAANLRQPAAGFEDRAPQAEGARNTTGGGSGAEGRKGNAGAADRQAGAPANAQNQDAMEHQVPDVRSRQLDPSCGITGETSAYAVLTDGGRLLNLDHGGNTKAGQAIHSNAAGRDMLNGKIPAIKPKVTIRGRVEGDRATVENLKIE